MSYLDLLKLASPEAIVAVTALAVLAIGLAGGRTPVAAAAPAAGPNPDAGDTPATTVAASDLCSFVAALGLAFAVGAVLMLPHHATLFGGMLVITPLTSLFKIICIALAFFTVLLASG